MEEFGISSDGCRLDGACRLVFQLENGQTIGHLAFVTESDPERGIKAELLTVPHEDDYSAYWLPFSERGMAWDWLRDVRIKVWYIEDAEEDEDGNLLTEGVRTEYEATIIDCQLEAFLVLCAFDDADPEWVSLLEDDWAWFDCPGPDLETLQAASKEKHRHIGMLQRAESAYASNARLWTRPKPAPF